MIFILLLAAGSCGSVLAYLISTDIKINTFQVGECRTEIEEDFVPPSRLEPGCSFTKDVRVKNIGSCECYVRIRADFTNDDMKKHCIVDWNVDDYEYNSEDGYYYYKEKLMPEDITSSLFTEITIDDKAPPEDVKEFDILIYSEALRVNKAEDWR